MEKNQKIYFPGPPYSLQKASYSLQFFLYVTLKHIVLLYAKIAGFLAIMGYFRTHTKENHIFSLIWACWPTVGGVGVGPPWRGETGPTVAPGSLELQKQPSFFLNLSVNIEI